MLARITPETAAVKRSAPDSQSSTMPIGAPEIPRASIIENCTTFEELRQEVSWRNLVYHIASGGWPLVWK